MSLIAWIVLGLIAGFFSSHIVRGSSTGFGIEDAAGAALLVFTYYIVSLRTRSGK
jgi:hypothetical protein